MSHRIYLIAERYLILAELYRECGPYLELDQRLHVAEKRYLHDIAREERQRKVPARRHAREFYIEEIATLVALLVLNDREADARTAYESALKVLDDEHFRTVLDHAMRGTFR